MKNGVLVAVGLALAASNCSRRPPPEDKVVAVLGDAVDGAAAAIQKLGGTAEIEEGPPGRAIVTVDLHGTGVSDADLVVLERLSELRKVDLRLTKIGDDGVTHLKTLRRLRFVNLFRTAVGDAGLRYLADNKDLETLLIGGTRVTDEGLVVVKGFSHLKKLSLFETAVSDAGMKQLAGLSELETLLVAKSKVGEAGLREIKQAHPKLSFDENI
jgi:hypothetical protein